MTPEDFSKGLIILQAGIGRELTVETQRCWFRILADLTAEQWQYACERYLAESKNAFPMPAQLRELALSYGRPDATTAPEAWGLVIEAVRRHGWADHRGAMARLDPIAQAAVRAIGGWQMLCEIETTQLPTVGAQFRMAFEGIAGKAERQRLLPEHLRTPAQAIEGDRVLRIAGDGQSQNRSPEVAQIIGGLADKLKAKASA